jgi:cell shape-determining protein MreC
MSYLQDKKLKQKRLFRITFAVVALFLMFFFRTPVFGGLSYITEKVFHPAVVVGGGIGARFKNIGVYFSSKSSLSKENEDLHRTISEEDARMANYDSVVAENVSLKETLGRKSPTLSVTLAGILEKPNQSPYDTLVIDAGAAQGVKVGSVVFATGNIPIGRIGEVYTGSSKVILYSNSGEKTEVLVSGKNASLELLGRGGGNFEMIMSKDFTMSKGDQVVLPGTNNYLVAIAESILSDPRDPFTKALLSSPVNIQSLKFVEVER